MKNLHKTAQEILNKYTDLAGEIINASARIERDEEQDSVPLLSDLCFIKGKLSVEIRLFQESVGKEFYNEFCTDIETWYQELSAHCRGLAFRLQEKSAVKEDGE